MVLYSIGYILFEAVEVRVVVEQGLELVYWSDFRAWRDY